MVWPPKTKQNKSLQITHAGQGMEKREPYYTAGGNVNWQSHFGEQYGGSLRTKIDLSSVCVYMCVCARVHVCVCVC